MQREECPPAWEAQIEAIEREMRGDFDGAEEALLEVLSRIRRRQAIEGGGS
jgi:hypothetical protein